MSVDLNEQYDKIFRFCYFKVHDRELAEDLTQETFLRFLERPQYHGINKDMQYLYTIAGNLCVDSFRKKSTAELTDNIPDDSEYEDDILTSVALGNAIRKLSSEDREILMLRYVNEVPVGVICGLFGMSRFAMSRRLKKIIGFLRNDFNGKEV